jgi:6-phosphogluconate dehydrogenase
MVHNGIEYADMQMICEAYAFMQKLGLSAPEMSAVFASWNEGELGSYLIDITAQILQRADPETGAPLVDMILDTAEQKGTGKWASQVALDLGVPAPTIAQAVSARTLSALKGERVAASGVLTGARTPAATGLPAQALIERIGSALLAAKVCAYAQGFALLRAADLQYGWQLPMATIAGVWRAGCIIRARLLEDIRQAHEAQPELSNLLLAPRFATLMVQAQQDLREVVALSALHGVAAPAFMSSLAYYDAYRSARLPANLLQAQRDYFGAHSYQRTDRAGHFHTRWQD